MSVTKRANGKWEVRYRDGRGHNKSKSFTLKKDAERYDRETRQSLERGAWVDPQLSKITLNELLGEYLKTKQSLKPKSAEAIRSLWDCHVRQTLGKQRIGTMSARDIHAWATSEQGAASPRRLKALGEVARVLDFGVNLGLLYKNPARQSNGRVLAIAAVPTDRSRIQTSLTHQELLALAAACGTHSDMILLAGTCGPRWAELVGVRACDLSQDGSRLTICRSLSEVNGRFHEGTTKNGQSRVLVVPPFLRDRLLVRAIGKPFDALLFGDTLGKPLRVSNFHRRVYKPALRNSGVPEITFHGLRHTAASLAISNGANVLAVSRMLGHSDTAITLRTYAHLFESDQVALAERIHELFSENMP